MSSILQTRAARPAVARISQSASQQVRHASLLKRPYRPYQFTQVITLSDGSTYMQRTTSPASVYKSTKDTRNHPLWQPSMASLRNVEEDEAGRLRAFREKFGRGWDADTTGMEGEEAEGVEVQEEEDSLFDLISGFGGQEEAPTKGKK